MATRRYQHVQKLLPIIKEKAAEGKTQREIAEELGLASKKTVSELMRRERRQEKRLEAGIVPQPKGRPRKEGQPASESLGQENKRLRMENELLRDFLRFTERGSGQG